MKDIKNPELRANVLSGMIPADRIAKMTAEVSAFNCTELLKSDSGCPAWAMYHTQGQYTCSGGIRPQGVPPGQCSKHRLGIHVVVEEDLVYPGLCRTTKLLHVSWIAS